MLIFVSDNDEKSYVVVPIKFFKVIFFVIWKFGRLGLLTPKEKLEGDANASALTDSNAFTNPVPCRVTIYPLSKAVVVITLFTSWGDRSLFCKINAARPATCGVAILVPDNCIYVVGLQCSHEPVGTVDFIKEPGANTSGLILLFEVGPLEEKDCKIPLSLEAPTVIAFSADAGEPTV